MERLLKPALVLGGGNVASATFNFVCVAIASRSLGLEVFGDFVIIQTTVLIIESIFKFPTWQAIIYFYNEKGDRGINRLLAKSYNVELLTSLCSFLFFIFYFSSIKNWLDLNFAYEGLVFSLVLLFKLSGPATAVFRVHNEFKYLSLAKLYTSIIKLVLYLIISVFTPSLFYFAIAITLTTLFEEIMLIFSCNKYLYKLRLKFKCVYFSPKAIISDKPFLRYLLITNFHVTVKVLIRHLDIILISRILGSEGVGLLKIMKDFGIVFKQLVDPLFQVLFPYISKFSADKKKVKKVMLQPMKYLSVFCLSFTIGFIFLGKFVINLVFGPEFLVIFWPTIVFLLGASLEVITISFHPTLLSYNKPGLSLKILSISSIFYFVVLVILVPKLGILGTSLSYLLFYIMWILLMYNSIKKVLNHG